jgi:hypothetical protein
LFLFQLFHKKLKKSISMVVALLHLFLRLLTQRRYCLESVPDQVPNSQPPLVINSSSTGSAAGEIHMPHVAPERHFKLGKLTTERRNLYH